jgi:hypothetical protein
MSLLLSMASGESASQLMVGGSLAPSVSFTRASSGWYQDASGILRESAVDQPRMVGNALILEGVSTNLIRNPRAEGIVGTAAPSTWSPMPSMISSGVTGVEDGIPYVDLNCAITGAQITQNMMIMPNASYVTAKQGDIVTLSYYVKLTSADPTNLSFFKMRFREATTAGGFIADHWKEVLIPAVNTGPLKNGRMTFTTTLTNATTGCVAVGFRLDSTGPANATLRIGAPQLELASFPSSVILPPVGTLAEATRVADRTQFPINGSAGAIAMSFMFPQPAPTGVNQGLLILDNGGNVNRATFFNSGGTNNIQGFSAGSGNTVFGTMTPGVPTAMAVRWSAEGVFIQVRGSEEARVGDRPGGIAWGRLGTPNVTYGNSAFGQIGPVHLYNGAQKLLDILAKLP